jgi:hypothetical protein
VQFFREQGCAGATVTRAVMGYGAGSRLHEDEFWRLSSDAPSSCRWSISPNGSIGCCRRCRRWFQGD